MMKVSENYLSHPTKTYNTHTKNIADSFPNDKEHIKCAFCHDLGKLSELFQRYIKEKSEEKRNKLKTTHSLESAFLYFFIEDDKNIEFLANFFTILKHHSNLPNIHDFMEKYLSTIDSEIYGKRLEIIKDIAKKANLTIDINSDSFMDFFDEEIITNKDDFFTFKKRYSRLILSDKYEAIFSEPYKNVSTLTTKNIDNYLNDLHSIIDKKQQENKNTFRTNARDTIFKNYEQNSDKNKFLIKASTGIGKTFISLELALKIVRKKGNKKRIITTIPFTSIIDQTCIEYENILGSNNVLKYHHSTKCALDNTDEKEQFSQKVFLSDIWHENFIVTTFNQLLNCFFSNKNRDNLRLETLRNSVIIIDEIQNIPRVLLKIVSFMFNEFTKKYDIDLILMSATMPHISEELENFQLISDKKFYEDKQNRYVISYTDKITSFDDLAKEITLQKNKKVLCVLNTIAKAKKLYQMIGKDNKNVYLLTTHQIPKHRKSIIEEIKEKLKNNEKIVLIATQLIEAGVDLDFDIGFREFAPLASIIQVAGRINREGKSKIPCEVVIFDFLKLENTKEDNKCLPYNFTDLQEDTTKQILQKSLQEIEIYATLEQYYKDIKKETTHVNMDKMLKNLEFENIFETFNAHFMPNQPWKVSLFVEQEDNQFNKFLEKREEILHSNKEKFEKIARVKELEKDLSNYTISVGENLIKELQKKYIGIRELFGRYILPNGSSYYTKNSGFEMDLTMLEDNFS